MWLGRWGGYLVWDLLYITHIYIYIVVYALQLVSVLKNGSCPSGQIRDPYVQFIIKYNTYNTLCTYERMYVCTQSTNRTVAMPNCAISSGQGFLF